MKTSESVKSIFGAMVKAQGKVKNLYPEAKGYGYDYVPLESVIDMLKAVLPEYGLCVVQLPSGGSVDTVGLTTRIIHDSGEWIESEAVFPLTDMKGVNLSQKGGAAITYARRYALCAAFGITGDKDIDANDKGMRKEKHDPTDEWQDAIASAETKDELAALWRTVPEGQKKRLESVFAKRAKTIESGNQAPIF